MISKQVAIFTRCTATPRQNTRSTIAVVPHCRNLFWSCSAKQLLEFTTGSVLPLISWSLFLESSQFQTPLAQEVTDFNFRLLRAPQAWAARWLRCSCPEGVSLSYEYVRHLHVVCKPSTLLHRVGTATARHHVTCHMVDALVGGTHTRSVRACLFLVWLVVPLTSSLVMGARLCVISVQLVGYTMAALLSKTCSTFERRQAWLALQAGR